MTKNSNIFLSPPVITVTLQIYCLIYLLRLRSRRQWHRNVSQLPVECSESILFSHSSMAATCYLDSLNYKNIRRTSSNIDDHYGSSITLPHATLLLSTSATMVRDCSYSAHNVLHRNFPAIIHHHTANARIICNTLFLKTASTTLDGTPRPSTSLSNSRDRHSVNPGVQRLRALRLAHDYFPRHPHRQRRTPSRQYANMSNIVVICPAVYEGRYPHTIFASLLYRRIVEQRTTSTEVPHSTVTSATPHS